MDAISQPITSIRLRGKVYPVDRIAHAVSEERGISCTAKACADGSIAFLVGSLHSCEALRKLFLFEDYRVITASHPDDMGSMVVIQAAPLRPRRLALSEPSNL